MSEHKAWCWATGLIEIGPGPVPEGAIQIATGPARALRDELDAVARHGQGFSTGKLIVPGVPEAPNQKQACDALAQWLAWCGQCKTRSGVRFASFK